MRETTWEARRRRAVRWGAGAAVAALVVASGCGEAGTGPSGNDGIAPTMKLTVTNKRNDTLDVNSTMQLSIDARDNFALRKAIVRVLLDSTQVLAVDSTNFTGASTTFTKSLLVPMRNVGRGRVVIVRAQAQDAGGLLSAIDSVRLRTVDTLAPVVTLNGPAAGRIFVRGDTLPIDITTADSSGVAHNGYVLRRVNAPGDTQPVFRDSLVPPVATASQRNTFRWVVPQDVIAGTYVINGWGRDFSGNVTNGTALVAVTIRDQTPPTVQILGPSADTTATLGDTAVVVRVRAGDNSGLVRVRVFGFKVTGDPNFGKVDTLVRFSDNFAPATGTFRPRLTDTTVTRRLRPTNVAAAAETVFVAVEATDESGNRTVATQRIFLSPFPFTEDPVAPSVTVLEPAALATIPLGQPIRVRARVQQPLAIKRLQVFGINIAGDPSLKRRDTTTWVDTVYAPGRTSAGQDVFFPAPYSGQAKTDTTIVRDLPQTGSVGEDTLTLVFRATAWNGRVTEVTQKTLLRRGPSSSLTSPVSGVSTFRGDRVQVQVRAASSQISGSPLQRIGFRIQGVANGVVTWQPAPVDSIITAPDARDATLTRTVQIPLAADTIPNGTVITITPYASDAAGPTLTPSGPGAVLTVNVPPTDLLPPVVYNVRVDARVERIATFQVRGRDPSGMGVVGYVLRDQSSNAVYLRDSVVLTGASRLPDTTVSFTRTIPDSLRGRRFKVVGFGIDASTNANRGESVPAGSTVPSAAALDTARGLFTYGLTFTTTTIDSANPAADLVVDRNGNAYLSNINRNRVEFWRRSTGTAAAPVTGSFSTFIPVGAQPWGMAFNRTGDTLFVANSGGTNISLVDTATKVDNPGKRIRTPNALVYTVTQSTDASTNVTRFSNLTAVQYADRPQFVAFSGAGGVYYSTRPTKVQSPGTVRRLLRNAVRNEVQFVTTYAPTDINAPWVLSNADSAFVYLSPVTNVSDVLVVYDRPLFGTDAQSLTGNVHIVRNAAGATAIAFDCTLAQWATAGYTTVVSTTVTAGRYGCDVAALAVGLQASGSDVTARPFNVTDLELSDTTFVAAGGDGTFVAFGEGGRGAGSRILTIREPFGVGSGPVGSASISVTDLTGNAADQVFGLAIDSTSKNVMANGQQAFFAALDTLTLFNLRLEGSFKTTVPGAGVAFHPSYVGGATAFAARVAFVAQGDTSIAIVDAYNYVQRRVLPLRSRLYGPIRAVLPRPDESAADPLLVVKVYALTSEGLVVIPLRTTDLQ